MVYAGRSVIRSTLTVTFILIRSIPEISTEVDTRAFIYFPLSHQAGIDRPSFRVSFVGRGRILVATSQILLLIHRRYIPVPVKIIIHMAIQRKLSAKFMCHIQSQRIIDIIFVCTVLISISRTGYKRQVFPILTEIIHLCLQILLLIIAIPYRRICQPSLIQFILGLQVKHIFLFSRTDSRKFFLF